MFNLDQVTLIDANAVLEEAYKNAVIALFNAGYSKERLIDMIKTVSGDFEVSFEGCYDMPYIENDDDVNEQQPTLNSIVFSNESQEQGDFS